MGRWEREIMVGPPYVAAESNQQPMPHKPQFKYFLSDATNPVQKNSEIWSIPLPTSRKQPQRATGISVTYGDYFSAVHSFLEQNKFEILTSAFSKSINRQTIPEEIEEIRVFLVKHGEFYHPSLIEAVLNKHSYKFVVNVAISAAGRDCIKREYNSLKRLGNDFSFSSIPEIYGYGEACVKKNRHTMSMFLGEWFEGFNEFHISHDDSDNKQKILVWDFEKGNYFLSPDNTLELYRQAAMILTGYYNIETFEQIFPWHHAAGDFVIKLTSPPCPHPPRGRVWEGVKKGNSHTFELKLITVRQYAPMFAKKEGHRGQGAGSREQGAESREQGAGSREQGAESREQRAESREQGAGSREQRAGSKEQGAGSKEQGARSREQRARSKEQGARSREQGARSKEQGAGGREQGAKSRDTGRDVEMILEAMLVFLLNLSIRMRLDRLNGVGDIVWSDDIAVQGTLKGFFQGLRRKDSTGLFSDSFDTYFHDYLLSSCTENDFYDLSSAIVNSYNPLAPEIPVIRQNIKKHAEVLFNALTSI